MKKLISLIASILLLSNLLSAQNDVTTFLGIPVDGYKKDMIMKLKAKGFEPVSDDTDMLEGEFNGEDVYISVVTNNNKVWRIAVADKIRMSESQIKIRFNNLCHQFENNPRYYYAGESGQNLIPDDEDIRYEMTVHDKQYQAIYYQNLDTSDAFYKYAWAVVCDSLLKSATDPSSINVSNPITPLDSSYNKLVSLSIEYMYLVVGNTKDVWFTVNELMGKYYISIFYDNKRNKANGEDL